MMLGQRIKANLLEGKMKQRGEKAEEAQKQFKSLNVY